jgi:hypothetical protein
LGTRRTRKSPSGQIAALAADRPPPRKKAPQKRRRAAQVSLAALLAKRGNWLPGLPDPLPTRGLAIQEVTRIRIVLRRKRRTDDGADRHCRPTRLRLGVAHHRRHLGLR